MGGGDLMQDTHFKLRNNLSFVLIKYL
jgi:hypothetical protein